MTPTSQDRHAAVNAFEAIGAPVGTPEPPSDPHLALAQATCQRGWHFAPTADIVHFAEDCDCEQADAWTMEMDPRCGTGPEHTAVTLDDGAYTQWIINLDAFAAAVEETREWDDTAEAILVTKDGPCIPLAFVDGRTGVPTREQIAEAVMGADADGQLSWDTIGSEDADYWLRLADAVLALFSQPPDPKAEFYERERLAWRRGVMAFVDACCPTYCTEAANGPADLLPALEDAAAELLRLRGSQPRPEHTIEDYAKAGLDAWLSAPEGFGDRTRAVAAARAALDLAGVPVADPEMDRTDLVAEQPDTDRPLVRITGDGIGRVWVPSTAAGGMSSIPPTAYEPVRPVGTPEPPSDPEEACPEFTHIGYCPYQECENGCKHAGVPTREQIARTAYEATHRSWDDITDGLREVYLAEADAVLALFSQPPDRPEWIELLADAAGWPAGSVHRVVKWAEHGPNVQAGPAWTGGTVDHAVLIWSEDGTSSWAPATAPGWANPGSLYQPRPEHTIEDYEQAWPVEEDPRVEFAKACIAAQTPLEPQRPEWVRLTGRSPSRASDTGRVCKVNRWIGGQPVVIAARATALFDDEWVPADPPPPEPEPPAAEGCELGLQGTCRGEVAVEVWDGHQTCARCMAELRAMADENDATDPPVVPEPPKFAVGDRIECIEAGCAQWIAVGHVLPVVATAGFRAPKDDEVAVLTMTHGRCIYPSAWFKPAAASPTVLVELSRDEVEWWASHSWCQPNTQAIAAACRDALAAKEDR